jgi:hypothetical protein
MDEEKPGTSVKELCPECRQSHSHGKVPIGTYSTWLECDECGHEWEATP